MGAWCARESGSHTRLRNGPQGLRCYDRHPALTRLSVSKFVSILRRLACSSMIVLAVAPAASAITLLFVPEADAHAAAAEEYRTVWRADGERIVEALDRLTGASLGDEAIDVIVFEGVSESGLVGRPMKLRASYSFDTKRATLVHELVHRYLSARRFDPRCVPDEHDLVSPIVAEAWTRLWGRAFAEQQAAVERARSRRYREAWEGVLELAPQARRARIDALLERCTRA